MPDCGTTVATGEVARTATSLHTGSTTVLATALQVRRPMYNQGLGNGKK